MSKSTPKPAIRILVQIGIPIATIIATYFWIQIIHEGWRSSSWPTATATVVSSQVGQIKTRRSMKQVAEVVYTYHVGDRSFTTNRFDRFGLLGSTGFDSRGAASEFVATHPKGTEFQIRYNPSHPEISVVRTGIDFRHGVLVCVLCFLYTLSYFMVRLRLRLSRRL